MKSILGEYGRMIILMAVGAVIFLFFFGNESGGLKSQLAVVSPRETLKAVSQAEKLGGIQGSEKMSVTIKKEKLKVGSCYDLYSFCTLTGKVPDAKELVRITKILNPEGSDLLLGEHPQEPGEFTPPQKGMYEVFYQIPQWYEGGYFVQTTKSYCYLAV